MFYRAVKIVVLCGLCVWACAESVEGLMQVFGRHASGHSLYGMTGSFFNPGPYGGFLAMTTAAALGYVIRHRSVFDILSKMSFRSRFRQRWLLLRVLPLSLCSVTSFLGLAVLPATGSRAAWLGLVVAVLLCVIKETDLLNSLNTGKHKARNRRIAAVSAFLMAGLCFGAFMMKKDSAIGRLHIWRMELKAIAAAPLTGTGPGTALGAYGLAQEEFFTGISRSAAAVRAAGCPEYAFNEYLKFGMEYGILGLLLSLGIVVGAVWLLVRRRSAFAYGLAAAGVFAWFSYPLSVPQTSVCIMIMLAMAGCEVLRYLSEMLPKGGLRETVVAVMVMIPVAGALMLRPGYVEHKAAEQEWQTARMWVNMDMYEEAVKELAPLYGQMKGNYRYMYDYGYSLHKIGEYEKSISVLEEGVRLSCDPAFRNIIGKNHEALGNYYDAEKSYLRSHYMVPARLYPLILLMEMYDGQGRLAAASVVASHILSMPVNPRNLTMVELRNRAKTYLPPVEKVHDYAR